MNCSRCGTNNVDNMSHCARCGAALIRIGDAETFIGVSLPPTPADVKHGSAAAAAPAASLPPQEPDASNVATAGPWSALGGGAGTDHVDFGPRYQIDRLLGQGGMGAVYKAWDKELERPVALKLIRPGLGRDPAVEQRFKQELLLASRISHKNILRIHDLGEAAGVKFISMAFVEGEDLHQLLERQRKLPLERALKIAKQLCAALQAAHSEGVVHRDFKPQNVLLDKQENVYVSDFGLAKSLEHDTGMTKSGELLGTPRYMAPEQVQGGKIDHRADIYAFGLVFYEMVTGDVPFHADSALQLMYKRVHEIPTNPKTLDPELPEWLVRVIMKCIERDPDRRYQSAGEIARDLEAGTAPVGSKTVQIAIPRIGITLNRATLGIAGAIVVLAAVLLAIPSLRHRIFGGGQPSVVAHEPVTVLVADFANNTGDPIFDATLEPMFNVALEGASFINAYNRGDARRQAGKLPNPSAKLDEQTARLIAVSQGVSAIVTGALSRRGDKYQISIAAIDAVTGNTIAKADVSAANKDEVLLGIPKLAAPIRKALGDTTPVSVQLAATEGSFAAANLETVHQYGIAMEQQFSGKMQEALQSFSKAAELDPNFARAYSGMAAASRNLGQRQDAEKYIKLAMEHVDRMTERERFRLRGTYYVLTGNWQKCIEEYGALVRQYPADNIGHTNLAYCYSNLPNMAKAMEEARRAVELSPKSPAQRMNLATLASYAGDFASGEREAREVQKLNPAYEKGYVALAYAQLGLGQVTEASETYQNLQSLSPLGTSLAAAGLADLAMYQGRFADAVRILQQGAAADLAAGRRDNAAAKLAALAYAQLSRNQKEAALASIDRALANGKGVKLRFLAARLYVAAGEAGKARELAAGLASEVAPEPQAYAKLIEGEIALLDKDPSRAVKAFTDSVNMVDTWVGRFDLGRAYLDAGMFVEADSEFDRCLKRRGEAMELFTNDTPTYSYLPLVYYYQGRVREGLKSPGFAEPYRAYLAIRGRSSEDPLLVEVRRRAGQ